MVPDCYHKTLFGSSRCKEHEASETARIVAQAEAPSPPVYRGGFALYKVQWDPTYRHARARTSDGAVFKAYTAKGALRKAQRWDSKLRAQAQA
jgi:hypothetical protein